MPERHTPRHTIHSVEAISNAKYGVCWLNKSSSRVFQEHLIKFNIVSINQLSVCTGDVTVVKVALYANNGFVIFEFLALTVLNACSLCTYTLYMYTVMVAVCTHTHTLIYTRVHCIHTHTHNLVKPDSTLKSRVWPCKIDMCLYIFTCTYTFVYNIALSPGPSHFFFSLACTLIRSGSLGRRLAIILSRHTLT